jgi:DNA repair exonuclease SbcCD ATPase subunit
VREKSLLRPSNSLSRVDSTQYGTLLLDVIDLQLEADGSISEIIKLLDELLTDVRVKQDNADIAYGILSKECTEKDKEYRGVIDEAKTAIEIANGQLVNLKERKTDLEREIDLEEGNEKRNKKAKVDAENARKAANDLYLAREQAHEESVDASNEAIEILKGIKEEVKVAPAAIETASSFNFIQIQKASVVLMDLKEKVERISTGASDFAPYLKVLIEIAASQDRFSKQGTVAEIEGLLIKLRGDIQNALDQLNKQEETEVENHKTFLDLNKTELDGIQERLKQHYGDLKQVREDIQTQEGIVEKKEKVKKDYEDLLSALTKKCEEEAEKYRRETIERNGEINTLKEVKDIFLEPEVNLPSVKDRSSDQKKADEAVAGPGGEPAPKQEYYESGEEYYEPDEEYYETDEEYYKTDEENLFPWQ